MTTESAATLTAHVVLYRFRAALMGRIASDPFPKKQTMHIEFRVVVAKAQSSFPSDQADIAGTLFDRVCSENDRLFMATGNFELVRRL